MAQFAYTAMDASGRLQRGRLQAAHVEELEARLARMGLDLIRYRATRLQLHNRNVARRDVIHVCFQLEQLLRAGVPPAQSLRDLAEGMEHAPMRDLLLLLAEGVERGRPLSEGLAAHPRVFDSVFVALVRAGEHSGHLPEALADLGEALRWQDSLTTRITQVLLYPAVVVAVMIGVLVFLMMHVVPQLVAFITSLDGELPLATRGLLATSDAVLAYGPWVLAAAVIVSVFFTRKVRRDDDWRRRWDAWRLRLWVTGPIRHESELARITRVMALMYGAGVPVLDLLASATAATRNSAVAHAMVRARLAVIDGSGLAAAFQQSGLFPPLVVRMLHVGESTGALDAALLNVSGWFERDVSVRVERLERALEPATTLILGVLVGWVVLAVLGPVYDLVGAIQ
jgi:type IV pilus assembly protein PilC